MDAPGCTVPPFGYGWQQPTTMEAHLRSGRAQVNMDNLAVVSWVLEVIYFLKQALYRRLLPSCPRPT